MKILLAKKRAMGDTVLLSSSVEQLKKLFPHAQISVLVPAAFRAVLEGNPAIINIWNVQESWFSLLPKIRAEKFDHFFQLHAPPGGGWIGRFSGAKKFHFQVHNAETEKAFGRHPNALEWDASCFSQIFPQAKNAEIPQPKIYLSEEEKEQGREFWRQKGVDPKRVVFLGLGASRQPKRWPAAHFGRLAELLRDRLEAVPAIAVGPGDGEEEFAARVINEMRVRGLRPALGNGKGDFIHLAGLSVRELAKALSAVRCYVGNDSGPKHIAAAVGTRTITIFGPEDPVEWHPYSRELHPVFFVPDLSCRKEDGGRWCGLAICEVTSPERHRCMGDIDPLDVYAALARSEP